MFNRSVLSYHDKQQVDTERLRLFKDEYSARYLISCFNPSFVIRMKELDEPRIVEHACSIGGSNRKFKAKQEVI
jgi:hypothetical protein